MAFLMDGGGVCLAGTSLLIKKRLLFVLIAFTLLIAALVVRVGWIQIVENERYQREAYLQQTRGREISPKRGMILDRNGKELAISASVEKITVSPNVIRDSAGKSNPEKITARQELIAEKLAEFLELDQEKVLQKIKKNTSYEEIKRKVDKELGDQIREWMAANDIRGVYIDEDVKRYYPNRSLASHILGYVGIDNQGLDGIEKVMEQYLKGLPGRILSEVDNKGRDIPFKEEKRIDPQEGLNVVLTIDETIQYFAEKAIEKAIDDNKVLNGAVAIVMDPRNGEILGMVSKPDFNPNDPFGAPAFIDDSQWTGMSLDEKKAVWNRVWRNKAVVDTYEPGSTFKAITSAAGLEENVIRPDSRVNDFPVTLGGHTLNCWRRGRLHGEESFAEGVYNSCNPVFVRVSQDLGIDKFYKYVRGFGFFDRTGIDLLGEAKSIFQPKLTEIDMAVASFGQRFQITPIQLVAAYGAIANGGKLIKPHVVKELTYPDGSVYKKFEPEVVRNVISKQTSDTLKEILEGVVSIGTGKNAYVKGYRVAGKTGTSETTETKSKGRYIASFMAFAPADNPVICALVALDHPDVYPHTGGTIAAPVAGKLVEDILNYLEVERRYTEKDKEIMMQEVYVPDVRNKTIQEAKKVLGERGLVYKVENSGNNTGDMVLEQTPKPDASIPEKSVVILYTYQPDREVMVKVPDILNKTISEATSALNDVGLNIKVNGLGTAVRQSVEPGKTVPKGHIIDIDFKHLDTE